MISRLLALESPSFSAPDNLALEAALADNVRPGELILYLWQNEKTVVIGRNQNAWKECRPEALRRDGGTLVRRLSGGGAVFHDLGNLNVSFCVPRAEEDIPRQTRVVLSALRLLGVEASASGRNDLELDGRKFSGHAAFRTARASCHHLTLMLRVDREALERYLCVSPLKLRSRGVDSVRARVTNLADRFPALTLPALRAALKDALSAEYGLPLLPFPAQERLPEREKEAWRERFSSWEWTFGRPIPFDLEEEARFPWGVAELRLRVEAGRIRACRLWTDAMDPDWPALAADALCGARFAPEDLRAALGTLPPAPEPGMRDDLERMLLTLCER